MHITQRPRKTEVQALACCQTRFARHEIAGKQIAANVVLWLDRVSAVISACVRKALEG